MKIRFVRGELNIFGILRHLLSLLLHWKSPKIAKTRTYTQTRSLARFHTYFEFQIDIFRNTTKFKFQYPPLEHAASAEPNTFR